MLYIGCVCDLRNQNVAIQYCSVLCLTKSSGFCFVIICCTFLTFTSIFTKAEKVTGKLTPTTINTNFKANGLPEAKIVSEVRTWGFQNYHMGVPTKVSVLTIHEPVTAICLFIDATAHGLGLLCRRLRGSGLEGQFEGFPRYVR